ncbi:MAG: DUF4342 domain-containing protein [Oscillospiraceae bacterium]|jgi:hypothetical protein
MEEEKNTSTGEENENKAPDEAPQENNEDTKVDVDIESGAQDIVDQIKEAVKKGNIARITIKKNDEVILNLPLNVGIAGVVFSAVAAPWALIASTIATIGLDCTVELTKTDGTVVDISGRTIGKKVAKAGTAIYNDVKEAFKDEDKKD